jgi:hypothetical protein
MKCLYKYPQRAYPYATLVQINRERSRLDREYELIDTGIFKDDKYFDVFVEYAKLAPEDVLVRITAVNRGPVAARLHLLPTLWFRNTWLFWPGVEKPVLRDEYSRCRTIAASHPELGERWLYIEGAPTLIFTGNETNTARLTGTPNQSRYVKDAFNEYVVQGRKDAVNPDCTGTKAAAHFDVTVEPGDHVTCRLRLSDMPPDVSTEPFAHFDEMVKARIRDADDFYRALTPESLNADGALILRQACAGMLWSKQYYCFDVRTWLDEHGVDRFDTNRHRVRDDDWPHMVSADVISMPDKWEYPWFASWDLAFQAIAFGGVDIDFAKAQLELMLQERYMHPSGQIPAHEWNLSDVTPPVHAWASIVLHRNEQVLRGRGDIDFLKRSFGKLLTNFTWWVNRKDRFGKSVFEDGFLAVDGVGVFDRSVPLPDGGHLEQADGTAWMALFCQNMLEIAVEISAADATFEDLALKFVDHFLAIASAINHVGHDGMWDDEDGFYYDVLRRPDGSTARLKVRSIVGLLPMCATTIVEREQRIQVRKLEARFSEGVRRTPELLRGIHPIGDEHRGHRDRSIFAVVSRERLRRILSRVLDEREFLSPYGIRSLSRVHRFRPCVFHADGREYRLEYVPADSDSALFGGNSNWRGPVWLPMNVLVIRALLQFYAFYGDTFLIECPTGSGRWSTLFDVAREISTRLVRIFLRDEHGRRPVYGNTERFHSDPHWRDYVLFHEYFHGDNGAGLGASHQTGWTGLVATLMQLFWTVSASDILDGGAHALQSPEQTRKRNHETHSVV